MKTIERADGNWLDKLLNLWPFCLDTESITTITAIAWLFKENGKWCFMPRLCGDISLFYNAQFFVRLSIPFGIFIGIRLGSTRLLQCGIGWKLNGRFAILFRVQTDASAAEGVTGHNYGQATGYDFGTH